MPFRPSTELAKLDRSSVACFKNALIAEFLAMALSTRMSAPLL